MADKSPAVSCSVCATDLTGFVAYDSEDLPGVLCYTDAKILTEVRAGRLDLNDPAARKKYAVGRFDLVKSYLRPEQPETNEAIARYNRDNKMKMIVKAAREFRQACPDRAWVSCAVLSDMTGIPRNQLGTYIKTADTRTIDKGKNYLISDILNLNATVLRHCPMS
jgi:hypothetical protein